MTVRKVDQRSPDGERFRYIDIGSIDRDAKMIGPTEERSTVDAPSRARQRVAAGDVLVALTRPNLNAVAVVPEALHDATASTGFDVLRSLEMESRWLFAHVRSRKFVDEMSAMVQGALYPAVNAEDVRSSQLPVPPLNEQKRIVAKLDALQTRSDAAKEALDAISPLLEKFRQSVLAAAFRGDLTKSWREQHPDVEPASVLVDRIRAERRRHWETANPRKRYVAPVSVDTGGLPDLPAGWCWASLGEIAEVQLGQRRAPEYAHEKEYRYIRSANITWGGLDLSDVKSMGFADPETLVLRKGDVLLNEASGSPTEVGKPALWDDELPNCCFQATVVRLRPFSEELRPEWLYFNRLRDAALAEYAARCPGIGIIHLTAKLMRTWPIPLAPLEEQAVVVAQLRASLDIVSEQATRQSELLRSLSSFGQSVHAKAFRGELVPQDPNDEPASVLLERIRTERKAAGKPDRRPRASEAVEEVDRPTTPPRTGAERVAVSADGLLEGALTLLRARPGRDLARSDFLDNVDGLSLDNWLPVAKGLASHPDVIRTGERKGTRYRWRRADTGD